MSSSFSRTPVTSGCYLNPEPFRRDSHEQPSINPRPSSSSKGQSSSKDQKSSQSTFRLGGREQGPACRDKDSKATITHWRFLLENRRDTANLRTADERHKIWRFCFHFHGITAVVRQDTLSCAHLRQQYDQD